MCVYGADLRVVLGSGWASYGARPWGVVLGGVGGSG